MAVADNIIVGWREERVRLHTEYSGIVEKAATEKRGFSEEERGTMGRISARMDELKELVTAEERARATERELSATPGPAYLPGQETRGADAATQEELRSKFTLLLRDPQSRAAEAEYRGAFARYIESLPVELRGLTMGQPTQAGYLIAPQVFSDGLIQDLDAAVHIRGLATIERLNGAHSLGKCKMTADVGDFTKGTEVSSAQEDTSLAFGKRELKPQPYSKLIKISKTLVRNSARADAIVRQRMAYAAARTQEKEFLNGTGDQGALGVMVANSDGISTSRDVSTGNTSSAITYAGLVSAKMKLKQGHRNNPKTRWMFHTDAIAQIMKLTDDQSRPIWQPDMRLGEPDRVLNVPVLESEFMPNTFTTGLYVGIIGNFEYYWIAENQQIEIMVADQLYAATNQNGYFCRFEIDGQPVLEEAFARVKLA